MKRSIVLALGIIFLLLTIFNSYTNDLVNASFQRSLILSSASSILIILTALFWYQIDPSLPLKHSLEGKEGIFISEDISNELRFELAWGSEMLLTTSAAATVLVYINDQTILKRGLISQDQFKPLDISKRALKSEKLISLVNTKFYPGKQEFDSIVNNLPSVIVSPIHNKGLVIVGGWTERCFTLSDERWIRGWSKKLSSYI